MLRVTAATPLAMAGKTLLHDCLPRVWQQERAAFTARAQQWQQVQEEEAQQAQEQQTRSHAGRGSSRRRAATRGGGSKAASIGPAAAISAEEAAKADAERKRAEAELLAEEEREAEKKVKKKAACGRGLQGRWATLGFFCMPTHLRAATPSAPSTPHKHAHPRPLNLFRPAGAAGAEGQEGTGAAQGSSSQE